MLIIGCDYHPSAQQIALEDTDTGEVSERRLCHREQAVHPYWMRRQGHDCGPWRKLGSHAGEAGNPDGVQVCSKSPM